MGFLPFYFSLKYTCAFLLQMSGEAQGFLITSHGDKCFAIIIKQGRTITYPCILNLPLLKDEKKKKQKNMKTVMKQGLKWCPTILSFILFPFFSLSINLHIVFSAQT